LDTVDLGLTLDRNTYSRKLKKYQGKLQDLIWKAYRKKRSVVAVFEGWDAAGKGSAIRRVTNAVDPRLFHLVQFAAPSDEERAKHYLWRFWRQLERDGRCTFFDRSWYGRVLVERVEQFASTGEWQRAYSEINQFEEQLVDHGSIVLKFWIHISQEEQLARFRAREAEPHKRHKITQEDWRNREKWPAYEAAVHEMVNRTSTRHAPWSLISGDDKPYARIQILKTFCKTIERALDD
jgi:polyphosphate kinase 2 (PPK2 family)